MEDGSSPFNLLERSHKSLKLNRFPMLDGIGPEIWYNYEDMKQFYIFYNSKYIHSIATEIEDISSPFSLLLKSLSPFKFNRFPKVYGIEPENRI